MMLQMKMQSSVPNTNLGQYRYSGSSAGADDYKHQWNMLLH